MGEVSYNRRQLARVLHLSASQLSRWQRLQLFPRQRQYRWPDLVRARALGRMEAAAVRGQRLCGSLRAISQRVPEIADPLFDAGWRIVAGRVEVHYEGLYMDALSGQLRLPFELPAVSRPAPAAVNGPSAERWFVLGLTLEGEPELRAQAAAAYEQCLALDPAFTSAHINLGTLRYHEHNYAAAERCYHSALALDSNYALAHFNLGNVLDETGRLREAIEAYKEAVRLVPDYADAHYNLALAYQRTGNRRKAVPHWRCYLGLDQQSPWAEHARTQLKQALSVETLRVIARPELHSRRGDSIA